jgi:hypothetical protein
VNHLTSYAPAILFYLSGQAIILSKSLAMKRLTVFVHIVILRSQLDCDWPLCVHAPRYFKVYPFNETNMFFEGETVKTPQQQQEEMCCDKCLDNNITVIIVYEW